MLGLGARARARARWVMKNHTMGCTFEPFSAFAALWDNEMLYWTLHEHTISFFC